MKMYQFRPTAKDEIERVGIAQTDIAARANYDRHEFSRRLKNAARMRPATANRVARAFGDLSHIGQDAALALLFEEIEA